jgi:hypothetical protein
MNADRKAALVVRWAIMDKGTQQFPEYPLTRRRLLRSTLAAGAIGLVYPRLTWSEPAQTQAILPNGGDEPFPIPWLDKNGNHNQPAGPDLEPSHVFHFKGKVGRCAGFTGSGTDNQGNRILFGTKTTDYGFMDGEYFAARVAHRAALTHI